VLRGCNLRCPAVPAEPLSRRAPFKLDFDFLARSWRESFLDLGWRMRPATRMNEATTRDGEEAEIGFLACSR